MKSQTDSNPSRRDFIKTSSAVAAGAIAFPSITLGEPDSRKLKIGFIGCGGRGTGAASQALKADSNVELWAMGDVFQEKMDHCGLTARDHRRDPQWKADQSEAAGGYAFAPGDKVGAGPGASASPVLLRFIDGLTCFSEDET